ncbi:unnamed protein product [Caenorhabditis sp. 36 PRJEB53466]|nr:unnamed protein product [Caenorhabditis sp. 36 PRJEB53466]
MAVVASTSDDLYANYAFQSTPDTSNSTIRVPKNSEENRRLKYGHQEEDNADIAYLNFPVIVPSLLFTFISFGCFIGELLLHGDFSLGSRVRWHASEVLAHRRSVLLLF